MTGLNGLLINRKMIHTVLKTLLATRLAEKIVLLTLLTLMSSDRLLS